MSYPLKLTSNQRCILQLAFFSPLFVTELLNPIWNSTKSWEENCVLFEVRPLPTVKRGTTRVRVRWFITHCVKTLGVHITCYMFSKLLLINSVNNLMILISHSLKIFVPITALALGVLVPVNYMSNTLERSREVVFSDIDKLSISNIPTGSPK